jgi:hypothetical protein
MVLLFGQEIVPPVQPLAVSVIFSPMFASVLLDVSVKFSHGILGGKSVITSIVIVLLQPSTISQVAV